MNNKIIFFLILSICLANLQACREKSRENLANLNQNQNENGSKESKEENNNSESNVRWV